MSAKSKGYSLIVALMCAFALTIYGAYSPARKAQKQQIVCVKFKPGVEPRMVEQYMHGFAGLKREIPQIVNYVSGKTIMPDLMVSDYDVMNYLTFQSEADIKTFERSAAYKQFVAQNKKNWEKILIVNADIQQ